ncbi:hypothetical protein WISP_112415 [Willisornis vidua]|uniref:Cystatin domain-containing protein n=1 Tax=Willisornis vidua TaxID=1566151 RepID=A0ABQ9CXW5_9PASS|nr:hypothetical protein WISP_112415 [Willisornis vidua]
MAGASALVVVLAVALLFGGVVWGGEYRPRLVGAPEVIDNPENDEGLQRALQFAMTAYNRASNDMYSSRVVRVISAKRQIVAGVKYIIEAEIARTTCTKPAADLQRCAFHDEPQMAKHTVCNFVVLNVPWRNQIELLDKSPKCGSPQEIRFTNQTHILFWILVLYLNTKESWICQGARQTMPGSFLSSYTWKFLPLAVKGQKHSDFPPQEHRETFVISEAGISLFMASQYGRTNCAKEEKAKENIGLALWKRIGEICNTPIILQTLQSRSICPGAAERRPINGLQHLVSILSPPGASRDSLDVMKIVAELLSIVSLQAVVLGCVGKLWELGLLKVLQQSAKGIPERAISGFEKVPVFRDKINKFIESDLPHIMSLDDTQVLITASRSLCLQQTYLPILPQVWKNKEDEHASDALCCGWVIKGGLVSFITSLKLDAACEKLGGWKTEAFSKGPIAGNFKCIQLPPLLQVEEQFLGREGGQLPLLQFTNNAPGQAGPNQSWNRNLNHGDFNSSRTASPSLSPASRTPRYTGYSSVFKWLHLEEGSCGSQWRQRSISRKRPGVPKIGGVPSTCQNYSWQTANSSVPTVAEQDKERHWQFKHNFSFLTFPLPSLFHDQVDHIMQVAINIGTGYLQQ